MSGAPRYQGTRVVAPMCGNTPGVRAPVWGPMSGAPHVVGSTTVSGAPPCGGPHREHRLVATPATGDRGT